MPTEIVVPALGESVSEATVAKWLKAAGEAVMADEPLVELETDKVTLEINAPAAGRLADIAAPKGTVVKVGQILGRIEGGAAARTSAPASSKPVAPAPAATSSSPSAPSPGAAPVPGPAARKALAEAGLSAEAVGPGSGKEGRVTKADIAAHAGGVSSLVPPAAPVAASSSSSSTVTTTTTSSASREERVPMSRLRQRIAQRLKDAQSTAAILTTFNEVDMSHLLALRAAYKDSFEKKHGVKLGFMSFFTKAAVQALKELPAVNAEIDGDTIIYKNHYDIGVAVGTPQGLVVPVVREADRLTFAEVEKKIGEYGVKARDGKLTMEEMTGGTFTISNGGVYGSLMSTPILNPPQSAILGMHKTQDRPVVLGGKVEIRPMMYLALSYDHRLIDGREAVTFLVRIKEMIEDPQRLLLEV